MSIKTSKIKVQPLRGMDTRFMPNPSKARLLQDMTWTTEDSWRESGGFGSVALKYTAIEHSAANPREQLKGRSQTILKKYTTTQLTYSIDRSEERWADFCAERERDKMRGETAVGSDIPQYTTPPNITLDFGNIGSISIDNSSVIESLQVSPKVLGSDEVTKVSVYESPQLGAPVNMHWFAQFNGAIQWLIYEAADGTLFRFFGAGANVHPYKVIYHIDGNPIIGSAFAASSSIPIRHTRHVRLTKPWENTHFYTFGGRVYMVNGINEPLVFDGRKCSRAGFAGSPTIKQASRVYFRDLSNSLDYKYKAYSRIMGLGYNADHQRPHPDLEDENMESKWKYRYRVSYLNERGQESPLSEPVTVSGYNFYSTTVGESMYANITIGLPIGPDGTVARRVYRTQNLYDASNHPRGAGYSNEFFYVTEIQDNITDLYNDSTSDNQLGALNIETLRSWPASVNRIAAFKNTLFLASNEDNLLYYSSPRQPEEIPASNFFEIGDSLSGPIVALYPTKNALVVFKRFGVYLIKGDPSNGFFAYTLTKDVGCCSSKSVREVPGKGLVFLGDNAIYLLIGALEDTGTITGITRISDPIEKTLRRINSSGTEASRSCINRKEKEYWLNVPVDSEVRPNLLLKFHYEIGEWSISEDFRSNDIVCTGDHRNYVHMACSDTSSTSKGLMVYSHAFTKKGSSDIAPLYKTVHMAVGNFYNSFDVLRVQVMAVSYGDNKLKCNFLVNREVTDAMTSSLERKQKRVLEDKSAPLFGSATLDGTYSYAEHRPIPIRYDVTTMHKGPVQEISFSFSPVGQHIQILGYMMEVRLGGSKEVVTLSEAFGGELTR